MNTKQFVEGTLSETVTAACTWINRLEIDGDDYVAIVCQNGTRYHVNIGGDSKAAIIADVMREVLRH